MINILPYAITALFSIAATLLIIKGELKWTARQAAEADKHSRGMQYGLTLMSKNCKNEDRLLANHGTDKPFDYGVREGVQIYKDSIASLEKELRNETSKR